MKRWNDPFPPTPQGFHERVESTLRGLDQDNMKHLSYKRIAAVVAAALIALLAVAAAAGLCFLPRKPKLSRRAAKLLKMAGGALDGFGAALGF